MFAFIFQCMAKVSQGLCFNGFYFLACGRGFPAIVWKAPGRVLFAATATWSPTPAGLRSQELR